MHGDEKIQYYNADTISIYEIWLIIRKRRLLIFIITLFSFGFSLAYSFLAPDVYKVSNIFVMSQYMGSGGESVEGPVNVSDVGFVNVSEIMSAMVPLTGLSKKQQAKALNLEKSVLEAIENIKISPINDTRSLEIEVTTVDKDAGLRTINALLIYANQIPFVKKRADLKVKLLQKDRDELKKIIDDPLSLLNLPDKTVVSELLTSLYTLRSDYNAITVAIHELEEGEVMGMAGETFVPDRPSAPKRMLIRVMGLISGIFLGLFLAFFMEWMAGARREHEARQ